MLYQRSLDIEQRLRLILKLIGTGRYSTPQLADQLGVSVPTISRDVQALRERGHDIFAERGKDAWCYVLRKTARANSRRRGINKSRIRRNAK